MKLSQLKTPYAFALAALVGLSGCKKPQNQTAESSVQPGVEAKAFHGEIYRSMDGQQTLTVISPDELELREGGTTLLCKYTKQTDALRVIMTEFGTNQVLYFRFMEYGLQDAKGNILLSPLSYATALEQQHVEQQRAAEEMKRRQMEKERLDAMTNESKKSTNTIATFSLPQFSVYVPFKGEKLEAIVSDVDVLIRWTLKDGGTKDDPRMWFGEIKSLKNTNYSGLPWGCDITPSFGSTVPAYFHAEKDRKAFYDTLLPAIKAWTQKYPQVTQQQFQGLVDE